MAQFGHTWPVATGRFQVGLSPPDSQLDEYMQREDLLPSIRVTELLRAALVGAPTVYEAYSEYESPTEVFNDGDALAARVSALRASDKKWFKFSVHFPEMGGEVSTVRIALKPEKCGGATWRENTRGWGLIHIQITDQPEGIGDPFPFEDLRCYGAKTVRDRFTQDMLLMYLGELGISLDEIPDGNGPYGPGYLMHKLGKLPFKPTEY